MISKAYMSELFNKEVNAQKELKNTSGVHASSCKSTKVCNENETEKNDARIKMLLMEGSPL